MDVKMRLKRIEGGKTGERIDVGSFSKDWKGSSREIFFERKKGSGGKNRVEVKGCRYARGYSQQAV